MILLYDYAYIVVHKDNVGSNFYLLLAGKICHTQRIDLTSMDFRNTIYMTCISKPIE